MAYENSKSYNKQPKQSNDLTLLGKVQPQDTELEEAVLGALMLEKDAYTIVCDLLRPEAFYDPRNQKIYAAIVSLGSAQRPIDLLTVTEQLRTDGELDFVGGPIRISELTGRVASAAHVEFHARIIAQKFLARELIRFSSEIQEKAFDESNDVDDLLQDAEGRLFEISQRNLKKDVTIIAPVITEAIKQIEIASKRETGISGLQTGFHQLDKITSGWQNS
ncbi:MAG: DnaB-like helicase N-terminal domain-containing protein, partial [Muribaculaceae bacterium]|nr:DnaB-like helicase N-terminal domain-containing protein [Muribaculaceae bacterium]